MAYMTDVAVHEGQAQIEHIPEALQSVEAYAPYQ
jgi:hypothetical protein